MSSIVAESIQAPRAQPGGRLLVVEPDGCRARLLERILRSLAAVDLRIVPRVADAVRAMTEAIPDLVVTSPLLSPGDETDLWTHIRHTSGASHVQVINLPYTIEARSASSEGPRGSVFQFLRPSRTTDHEGRDGAAVREEIAQYLARAVARRDVANARGLVPDTTMTLYSATEAVDRCAHADRRRAARRMATDLPGLWTVRLPWGSDARLVDVSNSGVLFESGSRISPGVTVDLQLLGQPRPIFVPARMVRAYVARIDASGVTYRMAAAFGREVRMLDFDATVGLSSPRVLADLLTRVLTDAEGQLTTAEVSRRFASELRRLLPQRGIQIRSTPSVTQSGAESIYFTLDQRAGSSSVMEVTFERGNVPTKMEFKLLKAAAGLASVALEIAQMSEADGV